MGWFGYGAMDGDDGMDLQNDIFHLIGVRYTEDYDLIDSKGEIRKKLDINQDDIYDWLKEYNWEKHRNPGFIQEVYIQATMQLMLDYNVKISERGKKVAIPFIEGDCWSLENEERKEEMQKLLKAVKDN